MTVSSTTSRVSYTGDGGTGPFAISFYFLANADIRAITVLTADGTETELVLDSDFTLTGAGEAAGGELTLTTALESTHTIVIFRDPSVLQETEWPVADPFPAASHEMAADRLIMIAQRLTSLYDRSVRQPDGDTTDIDSLPAKVSRASKYLAFDSDGNPIATDGTTEENPVSVFMATVLDDNTASAARTTLGVAIGTDVQAYDADTAKLDVEDQALTGGVIVTSKDLGTAAAASTVTPDPGDRPMQHYINGGAHTLAPSANVGSMIVDITNNASAGAITTSGWTKVSGDGFTTTNGHKFRCACSIGNGGSLLIVQALQ